MKPIRIKDKSVSVPVMQKEISRHRLSWRRILQGGTYGTAGDTSHILVHLTRSNARHLRGTPEDTYTANLLPFGCTGHRDGQLFQRGSNGVPGGGDALNGSIFQWRIQRTEYTPLPISRDRSTSKK